MADKKPGRGVKAKKGKKEPKPRETTTITRKSNKREKAALRHRLFDGKIVMPAKYYGSLAGIGNYTAGMVNGELILDEEGKPMHFRDFPLGAKPVI